MRKLRQFDLQFALEAARALREDIENQAISVQHPPVGEFLEITLLARTQGLVNQDQFGVIGVGAEPNFIGLAGTHEILRIGPRAVCKNGADTDGAGRGGQRRKLSRVVRIDGMADADTDQDGALAPLGSFK